MNNQSMKLSKNIETNFSLITIKTKKPSKKIRIVTNIDKDQIVSCPNTIQRVSNNRNNNNIIMMIMNGGEFRNKHIKEFKSSQVTIGKISDC